MEQFKGMRVKVAQMNGTHSNTSTPSPSTITSDLESVTLGHPTPVGTPRPQTPRWTPALNGDPSKDPDPNDLLDREERAVAALLTRFKALVTLAAEPVQDGATKEVAAAQALQMEVESSALVRAAEDLLQLTRELKELWLFGPLRGIKEGEGEGQMNEDSQKVGELVEAILKRAADGPTSAS